MKIALIQNSFHLAMRQKIMSITTVVLSLALVALFIPADNTQHHAFAAIADNIENQPAKQLSQGLGVELTVPSNVYATQLTPINIKVSDVNSSSSISHVDWAISVKDPEGNIIWKTTTAHSHTGVMSFNVAFPMAGESTI